MSSGSNWCGTCKSPIAVNAKLELLERERSSRPVGQVLRNAMNGATPRNHNSYAEHDVGAANLGLHLCRCCGRLLG